MSWEIITNTGTCDPRNNVLKLWKFVVADLKLLGAKYFYGKLCVGNINHVNIRTLQLILTKICLVLGVTIIIIPIATLLIKMIR